MGKKPWLVVVVFGLILLNACAQQQRARGEQHTASNGPSTHTAEAQSTAMPPILLPLHGVTPTPAQPSGTRPSLTIGKSTGTDPYGQPPAVSVEETQLTQQLFTLIKNDRSARGLYPYTWNGILAGGARLHSWNMYHCGFSHTCPDGKPQCERIASEGFANAPDCGENIAYAGPYPTPWQGVKNIQEGMVNEPPPGWHRIHLFSTTLHKVGVGVYVDPSGFIWFTEDLVS